MANLIFDQLNSFKLGDTGEKGELGDKGFRGPIGRKGFPGPKGMFVE